MWNKTLAILFVATSLVAVIIPRAFGAQRLTEVKQYLGTDIKVDLCYTPDKNELAVKALAAVWAQFASAHASMNGFNPESDVSRINRSHGDLVIVSDDVYELLKDSKRYAVLTHGVFDISVGPLVGFWKNMSQHNIWPTTVDVYRLKGFVGADRIKLLDENRVQIPLGMNIDLGGDAAGFLADRAAKILRSFGFYDFLVDAGGEVYAGGVSCDGGAWRVGVRDPRRLDAVGDVFLLRDMAVSTSGSCARNMRIKGTNWSHIINPVTGFPVKDVVSATVIAPLALDADVLSTALAVLGPWEGFKLIDSLGPGYAAMVVQDVDGVLQKYATNSYNKFVGK